MAELAEDALDDIDVMIISSVAELAEDALDDVDVINSSVGDGCGRLIEMIRWRWNKCS